MSKKTNDAKLLSGFKKRLTLVIEEQFGGKHTRLARSAGVGASTIQGWVDKESVNPNGLALAKVAKACGRTVEWLLTGEEPKKNKSPGTKQMRLPYVGEVGLDARELELLGKAVEIIRSKDIPGGFDVALSNNINAFYTAVKNGEQIQAGPQRGAKKKAKGKKKPKDLNVVSLPSKEL